MPLYQSRKIPTQFSQSLVYDNDRFLSDFHLVAELLESAGDESEAFTLYVSTCRNIYLTINALFHDVREIFGRVTPPGGLFGSLQESRGSSFRKALEFLNDVDVAFTAFGDKTLCWSNRNHYSQLLETLLKKFPLLSQDHLRQVLHRVVDYDEAANVQNVRHYFEFNQSESPEQRLLLTSMKGIAERLHSIGALVKTACNALASDPSAIDQTTLFPDELGDSFRAFRDFSSQVNATAFLVEDTSLSVRAAIASLDTAIENRNFNEIQGCIHRFFAILQDAVGHEYKKIAHQFAPNIGKSPMPPLFLVDLSVPAPLTPDQTRKVQATEIPLSNAPVDSIRVAIGQPPFSPAVLGVDCTYKNINDRDLAKKWVLAAISTAASENANLLVLPELFLPADSLSEVHEHINSLGLTLVAGVEGIHDQNGYSNTATIRFATPSRDYQQYKRYPANTEPGNLFTKGGQLCFVRSAIGTFSVVICSDFREFDVMAAIEGQSFMDFMVVCSCNQYHEIWKHLAIADAARLHCFVLICNWSEKAENGAYGLGSFCASPLEKASPDLSNVGRTSPVKIDSRNSSGSLLVHDLNLTAVFHNREKPQSGCLPCPQRRLRKER
jgi:predicted amidohydrolase